MHCQESGSSPAFLPLFRAKELHAEGAVGYRGRWRCGLGEREVERRRAVWEQEFSWCACARGDGAKRGGGSGPLHKADADGQHMLMAAVKAKALEAMNGRDCFDSSWMGFTVGLFLQVRTLRQAGSRIAEERCLCYECRSAEDGVRCKAKPLTHYCCLSVYCTNGVLEAYRPSGPGSSFRLPAP